MAVLSWDLGKKKTTVCVPQPFLVSSADRSLGFPALGTHLAGATPLHWLTSAGCSPSHAMLCTASFAAHFWDRGSVDHLSRNLTLLSCAGGPSYLWPVTSNGTKPLQFALHVSSTGRGLNNTVQLTDICQQDVTVTDASGATVFQQPPPSNDQAGSCMCAPCALTCSHMSFG